ncbi:MAG: AraC family transcriptional regulator [Gordonia paraffinivorans]
MSTSLPLADHTIVRTTDLDAARAAVARSLCPHRLTVRARGLSLTHNATTLGHIGIHYIDYRTDVDVISDGLPFVLVQIPLAGHSRVASRGDDHALGPGQAVVTAVGESVRMAYGAHNPRLMVQVTPRAYADRSVSAVGEPRTPGTTTLDLTTGPGRTLRSLVDAAVSHADSRRHPESATLAASLGIAVIDSLVAAVDSAGTAGRDRAATIGQVSPSARRALRRALDVIHSRCAEPLSVAEVAVGAGTSTRTLQVAFRAEYGMSPGAYIRGVRLDHIHHDLRAGEADSVTDVALRWGILHLGRFSHDYHARFGELPSHTLRRRAD